MGKLVSRELRQRLLATQRPFQPGADLIMVQIINRHRYIHRSGTYAWTTRKGSCNPWLVVSGMTTSGWEKARQDWAAAVRSNPNGRRRPVGADSMDNTSVSATVGRCSGGEPESA